VQNGLAVKADKIDRGAVDGVRREKGFDRFHMTAGDHGVGQLHAARPRAAVLEQRRVRDRAAQQRPVHLGIGKNPVRPRVTISCPSVSMIAASTPSIEVPLIRPIARTVRIGSLLLAIGNESF
jgi:hypothetical protein